MGGKEKTWQTAEKIEMRKGRVLQYGVFLATFTVIRFNEVIYTVIL